MTKFADQWEPNGPFGIVTDSNMSGGYRVVTNDADKTDITILPPERQKVGMLVYVTATNKTWRLTTVGVRSPGTETYSVNPVFEDVTVGIGNGIPSGVAKSVIYIDETGKLAQDNPRFTYDAATKQLTAGSEIKLVGDAPKQTWQMDVEDATAYIAQLRVPGYPTRLYDASYSADDGSFRQYVGTHNDGMFAWGTRTDPLIDVTWMSLHGADGLTVYLPTTLTQGLTIDGAPSSNVVQINPAIARVFRGMNYASASPTWLQADYVTVNSNPTTGSSGSHITYAWNPGGTDGFFADFFRSNDDVPRVSLNKVINNTKLPFIELTGTASTSDGGVTLGATGNEVGLTINGSVAQNGSQDVEFGGTVFMHNTYGYEIDGLPVFTLNPANQLAAWGIVETTGGGAIGYQASKGLNTVSIIGNKIRVTLPGTLPTANYAVFLEGQSGAVDWARLSTRTTTYFEFEVFTWNGSPVSDYTFVNLSVAGHRIAVALAYPF